MRSLALLAIALVALTPPAVDATACADPADDSARINMKGELARISERTAERSADLLLGSEGCVDGEHPVGAMYDRFDVRETLDRARETGEREVLDRIDRDMP